MAFVRKKVVKGQTYFYLVESRWEDGRPRQKVLVYLGQCETVEQAYAHWKKQLSKATDTAGKKQAREMIKKLEEYR